MIFAKNEAIYQTAHPENKEQTVCLAFCRRKCSGKIKEGRPVTYSRFLEKQFIRCKVATIEQNMTEWMWHCRKKNVNTLATCREMKRIKSNSDHLRVNKYWANCADPAFLLQPFLVYFKLKMGMLRREEEIEVHHTSERCLVQQCVTFQRHEKIP